MLKALDAKIVAANRWYDAMDKTNPMLRFLLFLLFVGFPLSLVAILPKAIGLPLFTVGAMIALLRIYVFLRPKAS